MCGTVFHNHPSLRRHLRDAHPGAAHSPTRVNVGVLEKLQGESALKRWVLTGGWRAARYLREPGRGPEGGPVARYADACQRIAREDEGFRRKFGESFHWRVMQDNPVFRPGRKSSAAARRVAAGAAVAATPVPSRPPPRAGPSRRAPPSRRQGGRANGRGVRAQGELVVISDDEQDEDADESVKDEPSP